MSNHTLFEDIIAFHVKYGLDVKMNPSGLNSDLSLFRIGFLIEEIAEYAQASGFVNLSRRLNDIREMIQSGGKGLHLRAEGAKNLEEQFDALIDLTYVAIGTAYLHGVDFDEGWRRVHEANMKKVRVERAADSKRGSTYDVVKPLGWAPPDLSDLVK